MSLREANVWELFDHSGRTPDIRERKPGRIELYVSTREFDDPSISRSRDAITERLRKLKQDGVIPDYEVCEKAWDKFIHEGHENNAGGHAKGTIIQHQEFTEWAQKMGVSLYPHFQRGIYLDSSSGPYYQFPDLALAVYESEWDYEVIFPHSDDHREYTIDQFLESLEDDKPWKSWGQQSGLQYRDYGPHGDLKRYILANSAEVIGSEWHLISDEQPVAGRTLRSGRGFVDLAFKHEAAPKYLFVEVKTDPGRVDKAFGQLKGYALLFASQYKPTPEDMDLVIAAPGFYEYHHEIAEEWGFDLLKVPA